MVGLILFGGMVLLFALNAPVAVALGGAAFAAVLAKGLAMPAGLEPMLAVQRLYAGADSFPLLAVPLFMLAGELMSAGGISRRIVALADALVGHLPGGLAAVSVVSAMFFAGVSGSAAADTAAVGSILIPAMIRRGYPAPLAGAVQAAGGCIGVIIPPSIPMIVFGALTGASIGRLFAGGVLPGLLMGVSLVALCVVEARRTGRVPERRF
ncbi:TRAP transporter large permease subunit, partial [Desulfovibrio oxamicus]